MLFYVWRNVVQVVTSYPIGVLADRYGALGVLILGYVLGALTSVITALAFAASASNLMLLTVIFFVAGLYVAVQEALESTVIAGMVRSETLATSYGALGMVNGGAIYLRRGRWFAVDGNFPCSQFRGSRVPDGSGDDRAYTGSLIGQGNFDSATGIGSMVLSGPAQWHFRDLAHI
jgi:hypothetical protein